MNCPILMLGEMIAAPLRDDHYEEHNAECDAQDCAWWDVDGQRCSLCTLAVEMRRANKKGK